MPRLVHVIGAGLAGLATAVRLQQHGVQIALYEAAGQAGGRCRSYYDDTLGATLDCGNHLILSGHVQTLRYVRAIGALDELTGPSDPAFAFADVAARTRWTVRFSRGWMPFWIADKSARVPGTTSTDYASLLPLLFAKPGRSLAQTVRCEGPLWERLLRPLFLAGLNVEPCDASATLASTMLRDALTGGGAALRPLVARNGLSRAFVDPALRMLQHGGAAIRLDTRLDAVAYDDAARRVAALDFASGRVALGADEAVVLAVPPDAAAALVPGIETPQRHSAVVNVHFAIEPPRTMRSPMMLVNGTAHVVFAGRAQLSATIHDAHALLGEAPEALARRVWAEVAEAVLLPADELPPRTRWTNLMLAGDWTATGLPATIEGAIRSATTAADWLLNENMERR